MHSSLDQDAVAGNEFGIRRGPHIDGLAVLLNVEIFALGFVIGYRGLEGDRLVLTGVDIGQGGDRVQRRERGGRLRPAGPGPSKHQRESENQPLHRNLPVAVDATQSGPQEESSAASDGTISVV